MSTRSVSDNEDVVDSDEVLVMNFSDDDENFPIPAPIKNEEYSDNSFSNLNQANDTFNNENDSKLENYFMDEDTKENSFQEFGLVVPPPEDEYILGADATPAILAIARNADIIEGNDSTEAHNQPDSSVILVDSDSNDSISSNPIVSMIPHAQVTNSSDETYGGLNEENSSNDISSIIITNVESIVEASENTSSCQIEKGATDEKLKSSESNLVLPNKDKQDCFASKYPSGPKQIFKCDICPFSAKTRFSLSRHIPLHKNNINISIEGNQKSSDENNIVLQSKNVEVPKIDIFKCKFCSFTSKIRFALQRHILTHTDITKQSDSSGGHKKWPSNDGISKCKYCSFVAKSKSGLATHIRFTHKEKIKVECLSCHKILRKQHLQEHKRTCIKVNKHHIKAGRPSRTSIKIIKATNETTNVKFRKKTKTTENNFDKDITASGTGSKAESGKSITLPTYQCNYCSYSSNFEAALKRHILLHTKCKQPIYRCHECNYRSTKWALHRHTGTAHKEGQKRELNEITKEGQDTKVTAKSVSFTTKNSSPKENSTLTTKLKCEHCAFSTIHATSLHRHKRLHTNYNKPIYSCKKCSYKSTSYTLRKHVCSTNNGIKYVVSAKKSCKTGERILKTLSGKYLKGKQDTQSTARSVVHETETVQVKKDNGNPQISKDQLSRSDNGDDHSQFQCTYCSHTSQNEGNFKIHLLMHSKCDSVKYQCKQCNYTSTKAAFTRHLKTHSGRINNGKITNKSNKGAGENSQVSKQIKSEENDRKNGNKHLILSSNKTRSGDALKCLKKDVITATRRLSNIAELKGLKENNSLLSDNKKNTIADLSTVLYVCEICSYETNQKETLIIHKLTHATPTLTTNENKIKCLDLKYTAENTEQFINSILSKPENNNMTANDKQNREYISLKNDKKQCSVCKRIFLTIAAFKIHKCENLSDFFKLVKREGENFTCKECQFSSASWLRVKTHLMVHKTFEEAAIHKCSLCDFRTKYKFSLINHQRSTIHERLASRKSLKYNCDMCNFKTNNHRFIRNHKISCHKESIICDICGFTSIFSTVMIAHKKKVHKLEENEDENVEETIKDIKYKCDTCDFQTNYKHNLQNHKILHININEVRVYKNKTYNVKMKEESHKKSGGRRENSNNRPKKEATESKRNTVANALSHPKNTDNSKLFYCNLCPFSANNKPSFSRHQYLHRCRQRGKIYKCNACSYSTAIPAYLSAHKRRHDKSKIYSCEYCTYSTHVKFYLNHHKYKKHSNNTSKNMLEMSSHNKPQVLAEPTKSVIKFNCKYCEYITKFRFKLKKHVEKIHSGKVNSIKSVKLSSGIERAVNINKNTIFKCSSCSYSGKRQYDLDRHVRSFHTGVTSKVNGIPIFKCNFCLFKTHLKKHLDKHVKITHVENMEEDIPKELSAHIEVSKDSIFKCSSCFYSSKQKHNLIRHFEMCHVAK